MSGIKNFVEETAAAKAGNREEDDESAAQKEVGEDEDEDGEGQDIDDLGSDAQKRKKQATDEMDYEENSDVEKNEPSSVSGIEDPEVDNEDDNMDISKEDVVGEDDGETQFSQSQGEVKEGKKKKGGKKKRKVFEGKETDRHVFVRAKGMEFEVHFKFKKEPHILLAQIAQKTAQKVYIQNCGKIQRCTVTNCGDGQVIYHGENPKERKVVSNEEKKGRAALHAAGIDFATFWELQDELDVRYLYSNSIHAMLNTYGVEAARETIMREINHVFKSYGISVSIRHLNLIADYMTHSGGYRPMSRMGGIAESTSPFCRMSFETATRFIVQAASFGEVDHLETPSSRICLGLPVQSGTGSFHLFQSLPL